MDSERTDLVDACDFMAGIEAVGLIEGGSRCTFAGGGGGCIHVEILDRFVVVVSVVVVAVASTGLVVIDLVLVDFRMAPLVLVSASFVDSVGPNGTLVLTLAATKTGSGESIRAGSI
jgi:hypothetical protein